MRPLKARRIVPPSQSPSNKSSSRSSEPDMIFRCRCGTSGNSDYFTTPEKGVCCDSCGFWSHLACQRGLNGMAHPPFLSSPKVKFECHRCSIDIIGERLHGYRDFRKQESKRLIGKAALARDGVFWYVVCLLDVEGKFWTVKWLRFNHFVKGSPRIPGEVTLVHENDIVDELWQDQKGRRQIRLGKFRHSWEVKDQKDELMITPNLLPFTAEVDKALSPHIETLRELLERPGSASVDEVPAIGWLHKEKRDPRSSVIPITGGISQDDQAALNTWFDSMVPGAKERHLEWIGLLPMAHSRTLLMASRLQDTLLSKYHKSWPTLLEKTWEYMDKHMGANFTIVDIDLEAHEILEFRLFSQTEEAGAAGNQQWGLDVGCHQDNWYPYAVDHDDTTDLEQNLK
ncbi:hypothetical protein F5146DRAFT_924890 [Armillaria mellea]|nr:hypothetical protein F5146DRAFT_924890 [Armillaria mellea]